MSSFYLQSSRWKISKNMNLQSNLYACSICDDAFSTAKFLVIHVQTKHKPITPLKFKVEKENNNIEDSSLSVKSRIEKVPTPKNVPNIIVNKQTNENLSKTKDNGIDTKIKVQDFETEIHRSIAGESFFCKICVKTYRTHASLKYHQRIHGEQQYSCKVCQKKFRYTTNMKVHERTHTGEKPYACNYCEMKFNHPFNRNVHERTHTGEKLYSCSFCDMKFNQSQSRKSHERTHTGEKPYECNFCGIKFAQSATRNNHKRTHTGEKPFSCSFCDRKYKTSQKHKAHERMIHMEKP